MMSKPDRTERIDPGNDPQKKPPASDESMGLFAGEYEGFADRLRQGPLVEIQRANIIHAVTELQKLDNRSWRLLLSHIQPPESLKKHDYFRFMLKMLAVAEKDLPVAGALLDLFEGTPANDRKGIFRQFSILARMVGNGINVLDPQKNERGFPMKNTDDQLRVHMYNKEDDRRSEPLMFSPSEHGAKITFGKQSVTLQETGMMLLGRELREHHLFGCNLEPPISVHPELRIDDKNFSGIGLIAVIRDGMLFLYDNMSLNRICFETPQGSGHFDRVECKGTDGRKDIGIPAWKPKEKSPVAVRNELASIIDEPYKPVGKKPPMPPLPDEQMVIFNNLPDCDESGNPPLPPAPPKREPEIIQKPPSDEGWWAKLKGFFRRKKKP